MKVLRGSQGLGLGLWNKLCYSIEDSALKIGFQGKRRTTCKGLVGGETKLNILVTSARKHRRLR